MTIQEALKLNKPFRRKGWNLDQWFIVKNNFYVEYPSGSGSYDGISPEDILATDWEVKNEPKVIWVNFYDGIATFAYDSKEEAETSRLECFKSAVTKKFIEVIE